MPASRRRKYGPVVSYVSTKATSAVAFRTAEARDGTIPTTTKESAPSTFTHNAFVMPTDIRSLYGLPATYAFHGSAASAATNMRARFHDSVRNVPASDGSVCRTGTETRFHPFDTGRANLPAISKDWASLFAASTDFTRYR